jgi:GNAT superfamily N-acetyltransferase
MECPGFPGHFLLRKTFTGISKMTSYVIRRLTAEDAADYRALRIESLINHPTAFTTALEDEANRPLADFTARMEKVLCYGGFDAEGALRGIVCVTHSGHPKTGHAHMFWSVYVQPEMRGTGMAKALMEGIIEAARPRGGSLRLFVTASKDFAHETAALYHEGVYHDGIHMRLDFPAA